jgi:Flp pilus assembly protein TadG
MRSVKDESGQVVVLTVLSMGLLIGFLAIAVDVGILFRAKRLMQTAADSAAIAAAQEYQYGDMKTAADAAAAQNGVVVGTNGGVVTVTNGPLYGPHKSMLGYFEAIVSQSQPTFLGRLFTGSIFQNSVAVTARAVATLGNNQSCVYTLGTSGTDILLNGTVDLTATTCSILDDSSSTQALVANGNVTLNAQSIGVVGGFSENGTVNIPTAPVPGIAPVADPLAFLSPPANPGSCSSPVIPSGPSTLNPGCYSSLIINGSQTVTLNPGVYYMTGQFVINGTPTVNGNGVTIYLSSSSASFTDNGNTTLNLSAPTAPTNPYNGILFYQNPSDTNQLTINGSSGSTVEGIFYAPTANLTLNGSGSTNFYASIVTSSLTFNGSGTLQNYAAINGASPLTAARLVE